jgi:hypothetical protein
MNKTVYFKGECQHCREHIEFPAEAAGTTAECPHCGATTELLLPPPPPEPPFLPVKTIVFTLLAILILIGGLVGAMIVLKRAKTVVQRNHERIIAYSTNSQAATPPQPVPNVLADAGFRATPVEFQKTAGSSLIYATGDLINLKPQQRFGVKVELNLLDAAGKPVGMASDYQQVIETNGTWRFKALVVNSKAARATITNITEEK